MEEGDFCKIEEALGVKLPAEYRRRLLKHPFEPGTTDDVLWDNADAIIDYTKQYRDGFAWGSNPKWPQHFLLIGDDGAASTYVLDLSIQPSPVLFLDHGDPNEILERTESFEIWLAAQQKNYDEELPERSERPTRDKIIFMAFIVATVCGLIGVLVSKLLF